MKMREHFKGEVSFSDLKIDELLTIFTENSVYTLEVIGYNDFIVSGGWFDQNGLSPYRTGIEGATWGYGDIFPNIVAAAGMRIKFKNGITTGRIKSIELKKAMAWSFLS